MIRRFLLTVLMLAWACVAQAQQRVDSFTCRVFGSPIKGTNQIHAGTGFVVGANDKELLCITAAHLTDENETKVQVEWTNGVVQDGRILARDGRHDLIAFAIPSQENHLPAVLEDVGNIQQNLTADGFPNDNNKI